MTVKELREALEEMPDNETIFIAVDSKEDKDMGGRNLAHAEAEYVYIDIDDYIVIVGYGYE